MVILLSVQTCFRLRRNNVEEIADVVRAQDQRLLTINGLGKAVLKQLRKQQWQFICDLRADMSTVEATAIWITEQQDNDINEN